MLGLCSYEEGDYWIEWGPEFVAGRSSLLPREVRDFQRGKEESVVCFSFSPIHHLVLFPAL